MLDFDINKIYNNNTWKFSIVYPLSGKNDFDGNDKRIWKNKNYKQRGIWGIKGNIRILYTF